MAVYHCTFRGTIAPSTLTEIFSHSMGIESSASESTVANALHDAWVTLWGTDALGLGAFFAANVTYTEVTVARVLDPMVPDLGAAYHVQFNPPLVGRSGNYMLPSQCAVAVSLTAGTRPDGRPFKGRFYLPPPHQNAVVADGTIPTQSCANIAVMFKDFFDSLFPQSHYPVIWSRTTEDLVNPITSVRIGNKIDTIRSRRNHSPEQYSTQVLTGPQ